MTQKFYKPLLALALLLPSVAPAQTRQTAADIPKSGFAYMHTGIGLGYPHSLRIGMDFIASHHQFTIGYTGASRKSPRVPEGAAPDRGIISFSPFDHAQQQFSGLNLGYGYVFYLNHRDQLRNRFVLRGSLLLGKTSDIINVRSGGGWSSYDYDRERTGSAGFLFEPRLEIIASKGFGVGVGPYVIATNRMFGGGVSANLLFGYVSNYLRPINVTKERAREERRKHPFRRPNPFKRPGS